MEGKGVTAEQSPLPGDNGEPSSSSEAKAHGGEIEPARSAVSPVDGNEPGMSANWQRPRVRVDARLLEATLLNLRKRIAAVPLVFDIPGAEEVTAERGQLLSQIDDYLLPRVRQSGAPLLVALIGSTGAGKSTLVSSVVGTKVSQTGVRRPTTNSPVLACHPDDMHWFAENMFLPTLPRVRQEGLAKPGRDGLLVLAARVAMNRGRAILDTFKTRVPRLAAHVDAQVVLRTRLRREAEMFYARALTEFDEGTRDGRLLVGEVLARWQDYTVSGDLSTALRGKRGIGAGRRGGKRARSEGGAARYAALDTALRAAVQSLVVSVADRAAEQVARAWRDNPGGAMLLAVAEESRARDERAKREFESAFGNDPAEQATGKEGAFDRSSPDLAARVSRAVSAWQDHLMRQLSSGGATPRTPRGMSDGKARISDMPASSGGASSRDGAGRDVALASVVTLVALLGEPGGVIGAAQEKSAATEGRNEIVTVPRELLASLMGGAESTTLIDGARRDLKQRVGLLLEEEMLRFGEVIDEAGAIDAIAAVRLYQAEYSLEAAR